MRNNKTFARRIGKNFNQNKKERLNKLLPNYLFTDEKLRLNFLNHNKGKKILEIGFGMAENVINCLKHNLSDFIIASEVYLNGVLKLIDWLEQNPAIESNNRILIFPDDISLIIANIPNNSLDRIYILFPDPWCKKRYHKKRLVNKDFIKILYNKITMNGELIFASDIDDYFDNVVRCFQNLQNDTNSDLLFDTIISDSDKILPQGYTKTKYHLKAEKEGRKARFLIAVKKQLF